MAAPRGCMMTEGLYLKANLEMPCWDDAGEGLVLRRLDPARLAAGEERDLLGFPALRRLRDSFRAGRVPHPGLCARCATRGHGALPAEDPPRRLAVLHVEPSFLCHLACPQCLAPKARKSLKDPPWHLRPEDYDAFLAQLRREGLGEIALVIFEGRGDPMSARDMGPLLALTKRHFPAAFTSVTTHGNGPLRPWMTDGHLDLMRFSVDGARPESYARYRVGGKLAAALDLMRALRDHPTRPAVEWKYILFEWNDSDEELREAAALAAELQAGLRFCLTHSPGRSRRIADPAALEAAIARLGLAARPDLTFQIKPDGAATVASVRAEALQAALERGAWPQALALDGGFPTPLPPGDPLDWPELPALPRQAATARALAARAQAAGRAGLAQALLARLRALAPDGPEAQAAAREEALAASLAALEEARSDDAEAALVRALGPAPPGGWLADLSPAPAPDPASAALLANLAWRLRDLPAARRHFRRYLALAPAATDRAAVEAALADIEARLADAADSAGPAAAAIRGARAPDGDDASLLRDENARLKRLLAEALLELDRLRNP